VTALPSLTPENTEFIILSFEGPDPYSMAGGLGVRVNHLSSTLSNMGFRTHLFFIGDPWLNGREIRKGGRLILHRWCQWISRYHPHGVYDGEEGKVFDFNESIPQYVMDRIIAPALRREKTVAILGEEWQTSEVICRLSDMLDTLGRRDRVVTFWNANNTFSFDRICWDRLSRCATITTVSRYMKHLMWKMGFNPVVIPNGIPKSLLEKVDDDQAKCLQDALKADTILCKVARWDPDKCWDSAIQATAELKQRGVKATLVARGGIEPYGNHVRDHARDLGLQFHEARVDQETQAGYMAALQGANGAEFVDVKSPLPLEFLRVIYRAADGVLANSGHEPFGIVGLETMAAGGVAFTGCTGEDYAIPFVNAFVLETWDPLEIADYVMYLREHPEESSRIRKAARQSARQFTWDAAARNLIRKLENQARIQGSIGGQGRANPLPPFKMREHIVSIDPHPQEEPPDGPLPIPFSNKKNQPPLTRK
jgi:glycosyltransferase involved in cell wall biosynthesis